MSFIDRILGRKPEERALANVTVGPISDTIQAQLADFGVGQANYNKKFPDQIATVYTCCKILSDYLARIPIIIVQTQDDGTEVLMKDDFRYDILYYDPNSWQNHYKFWNAGEYVKNLKGNSFAKINRSGGRPTSLEPISSALFVEYKLVRGQLYYYFFKTKNAAQADNRKSVDVHNSANILHFTNVTKDGVTGISPIQALDKMYNVNWHGWTTLENSYKRGLKSSKAIKYPIMVPGEMAQTEARRQFEMEFGGSSNAEKLVSLPKGAELIDLQMSNRDAEFISTIKFSTEQIGAAFRVPAHMLNILESTKFNSVQEMQRSFLNDEFGSTLKMYEDELNFKLLSLEERKTGLKIRFDIDALLSLDLKTRIDIYDKQIKGGTLSVNEARISEGLSPIENGDKNWMPSNFVYIQDRVSPGVTP